LAWARPAHNCVHQAFVTAHSTKMPPGWSRSKEAVMKSILALMFAAFVVVSAHEGEWPWQTGGVVHVPPGPHA